MYVGVIVVVEVKRYGIAEDLCQAPGDGSLTASTDGADADNLNRLHVPGILP